LQAFWPLQAFLSVLQAPCPLQSFCPLQACFAGVVAAPPEAAGAAVVAAGLFAGGVDSPQPIRIPPTAAAMKAFVIFMKFLVGVMASTYRAGGGLLEAARTDA
jgi:hypothetical protein